MLWVLICMVYLNLDFFVLHNCSKWNFSLECYVLLILNRLLLDIQATFEVKFQSIHICDATKAQVMRNPKTFLMIIISLIWRLSKRNYHIYNETVNENAKSERIKSVRSQIVTNTVAHLVAVFSEDQFLMIFLWKWPFSGAFLWPHVNIS